VKELQALCLSVTPTGVVTAKPFSATVPTVSDEVVKKEAVEIAKASGEETVAPETVATATATAEPEDESVKGKV
jgi:hypothetical protein